MLINHHHHIFGFIIKILSTFGANTSICADNRFSQDLAAGCLKVLHSGRTGSELPFWKEDVVQTRGRDKREKGRKAKISGQASLPILWYGSTFHQKIFDTTRCRFCRSKSAWSPIYDTRRFSAKFSTDLAIHIHVSSPPSGNKNQRRSYNTVRQTLRQRRRHHRRWSGTLPGKFRTLSRAEYDFRFY